MKFIKLLFLFSPIFIFSQNANLITMQGKLVFDSSDLEGISIVNVSNSQATLSEKTGLFTINGSVGDTLNISSVQFEKIKYILLQEDIIKQKFFIYLKVQNNTLAEVEINQFKKINSKSLGLISKDIKVYTPAERRLSAASGGITGLINLITGTTGQFKKELLVEKKEFAIEKVSNYFEDDYFSTILKLPKEKIKGFKFYLVENQNFVTALNSKNKNLTKFLMSEIAQEYKKRYLE
jgi:hypothetical protein